MKFFALPRFNELLNRGNRARKKLQQSDKIVKDKINILLGDCEDKLEAIRKKGLEELADVREVAIRQQGGMSGGIIIEKSSKKIEEIFSLINEEIKTVKKKIKEELYTLNETDIGAVSFLNEENERLKQLEKKANDIKQQIQEDSDKAIGRVNK